MENFIEVTEVREPIGVEDAIKHRTLLNVNQIVAIQSVEPHIAKALGYNTIIVTTKNSYCVFETMDHIQNPFSSWS
jgi:hypothetical protein